MAGNGYYRIRMISGERMDKTFAPTYPKTPEGWIQFPDDVKYRKSMFPAEVMKHYAKFHMYLEQAIIDYTTNPGDTVLDPMSGTGTLMMAALVGRTVICIEIEKEYHKMQQRVLAHLRSKYPDMSNCVLIQGNCKLVLPIPCNHIIFSPPYAAALKPPKTVSKFQTDKYHVSEEEYQIYAKTTGNVGLVNTFLYNQTMGNVYKLCYQSLIPGGTMTTVTKDITENGKRTYLSRWIERVCTQMGFQLEDHFKHKIMGGPYQDIRRAAGLDTIDDEDVEIFRKEG